MDMGNFFLVPVNYLAVFSSAVTSMVIGFIWYGPLFGKKWEKLVGYTREKLEKDKKEMLPRYLIMFLSSLIMGWILFHFIWYAAPASYTLFIALKVAFYAWIGFAATVSLTKFLFSPEKKSWTLFSIDTGYYLVSLLAMALVFFLFK